MKKWKKGLGLFAALLFASFGLVAQGAISGTITDGDTGEPLIGANVIVEGSTLGTVTDFDGNFNLNVSQAPPFNIEVSYTGYELKTLPVNSYVSDMQITLSEGLLFGEDVIISASRKREKVQEAPASVSVIGARKLEASPAATDPTRNLVNTTGVQIQQQSAAAINIEMRGSANIFDTNVFPIKDYRSLIGAGVGTFTSGGVGLSTIDISRIEVVRGPGSALYGPGVTAGVVHFITKSPIDDPGTSIELIGGELSTYGGALRHAGKSANDKFGYKINFSYKKGDEFTLDGSEGQIEKFQSTIYQPNVTAGGVVDNSTRGEPILMLEPDEIGNVMSDDWNSLGTDLTLEFRPQDNLNLVLAGGYNKAKQVFYNSQGEGLSQNAEYWLQGRIQAGGLFAQVFYVDNDGGTEERPTFLYQTGNRTPVGRQQLEVQTQYNFDINKFGNWTAGFDYRRAAQDTENLVYGRNEDDDTYAVYGGYVQTKFELGNLFDLVLAGRYDQFSQLDDGAFAPRAALVFKPSPKHTFRASYNRSSTTPSNLNLNIDFPVASPVPGLFDIWLSGAKTPQNFDLTNGEIDLVLDNVLGLPSDALNLPIGTPGLPLSIPYAAVTPTILAQAQMDLTADQYALLESLLLNYTPGGVTGELQAYNIFNGMPFQLQETVPSSGVRNVDTYEIGYKGLIADKVGIAFDLYNNRTRNFTRFSAVGPTYRLANPNIGGDLGAQVQADIQPRIEQALLGAGVPADQAAAQAAQFGALLNTSYNQGGAAVQGQIAPLLGIIGALESDRAPDDNAVHSAGGYLNFGEISYYGFDGGLDFYASNDLSFFFNYSWLSQTDFSKGDLGEPESSNLVYSLNVPKNKFRTGFTYAPANGFRFNASFQHDDSFFGNYGQFQGDTDEKNIVDAGIGYKFANGLSLDVTAQNLFDNEYRAFAKFPKIGRRVLGRLTYDFGDFERADTDGDGVTDKKDLCPNIAGLKEFGGCPDSDGDGITDAADNCPMTAGSSAMHGCPDADGDGVADRDDECPNQAGPTRGCPDRDGDGETDAEEQQRLAAEKAAREAAEARKAAEKAAAEAEEAKKAAAAAAAAETAALAEAEKRRGTIRAAATELFSRTLRDVQFETASTNLRKSSHTILDEVVSLMSRYNEVNIRIEGHTDSQGSEASNLTLSQNRAASVKTYLVEHGIASSRITTAGFGEAQPIADNKTSAGRAQNRRVDFKLEMQ